MAGLSIADAVAALTAPGAPFEMEERDIGALRTRVWKNAPGSLRAVLEASRAHGDLPFLVYEDERVSFAEHYRRCAALAHALVTRYGIRKGDRVAIAMRNFPEWSVAFWAAAAVGAVVVPLNAWMTGPELEYCLADSGASVLVADAERAERLQPHLAALRLTATIVARATGKLPPGLVAFAEAMGPSDA
ncbi:MAG TPA: AMP-binding protein, partial [Stellaceae bacterium]|nr:AMP-binding protein [Stellaceae bacterium]